MWSRSNGGIGSNVPLLTKRSVNSEPPISGSLTWCRGLVERVQIPMQKLQQLDRAILEREEAKEVTKVYATIVASLQEFANLRSRWLALQQGENGIGVEDDH